MDAKAIVRWLKQEIKRLWWLGLLVLAAQAKAWTPLEEAGYQKLPDTAQIATFLAQLADRSPLARFLPYGRSAGGRPLVALLLSDDPEFLRTGRSSPTKLTVMLVAGQHGTEPSGTEALLSLADDVAAGLWPPLLAHLDLILIPNSNPDGRDLHRRVNAAGVNLSTDYVRLSQPETQSLVKLLLKFRPHALLDVHESAVLKRKSLGAQGYLTDFEAQFEYANHPNVAPELRLFAKYVFLPELVDAVRSQGLPARHYIGEITSIAQPITHGGISLRNLRNYAGMRGVFALLVENRLDPPGDWPTPRNIKARLAKQRLCVQAFLEKLIAFRQELLGRIAAARDRQAPLVALQARYGPLPACPKIAIALRRLDDGQETVREFTYLGRIVAEDWHLLPRYYAITAHRAEIARLLDRHGLGYRRLDRAQTVVGKRLWLEQVKVQRWRQGVVARRAVAVRAREELKSLTLHPGDLLLDLRQEGGLAWLLLDPRSSTSLFQEAAYTSWLVPGRAFFGVALFNK
nr:peptidase M14, carboxypeptidase A [uncultured Gammaproteobacteria bacterium]